MNKVEGTQIIKLISSITSTAIEACDSRFLLGDQDDGRRRASQKPKIPTLFVPLSIKKTLLVPKLDPKYL